MWRRKRTRSGVHRDSGPRPRFRKGKPWGNRISRGRTSAKRGARRAFFRSRGRVAGRSVDDKVCLFRRHSSSVTVLRDLAPSTGATTGGGPRTAARGDPKENRPRARASSRALREPVRQRRRRIRTERGFDVDASALHLAFSTPRTRPRPHSTSGKGKGRFDLEMNPGETSRALRAAPDRAAFVSGASTVASMSGTSAGSTDRACCRTGEASRLPPDRAYLVPNPLALARPPSKRRRSRCARARRRRSESPR